MARLNVDDLHRSLADAARESAGLDWEILKHHAISGLPCSLCRSPRAPLRHSARKYMLFSNLYSPVVGMPIGAQCLSWVNLRPTANPTKLPIWSQTV